MKDFNKMDPLSIGMAVGGTALKLASLPSSIRSQRLMERQLKDLSKKPVSRFEVDPKIEALYRQSYGEASNPRGFGGAQVAGFRNNIGRIQRGRFSNAINTSGGQGSRAINAILQGQELDALGNFYTADENLRRSNRLGALNRSGSYANQFQNVRNQNTNFDQRYRLMQEQALGEGIRSQKNFRTNMLGGAGSDLITSGLMMGYGSGNGDEMPQDMGYSYNPRLATPRLAPTTFGQSVNSGLVARRNRFRDLGAYN